MQLINLLMLAAGILTFLSGFAIFASTVKAKFMEGVWHLIFALGAAAWSIFIGIFLTLPTDALDFASIAVAAAYVSAAFMFAGFVGFTSWRYRLGKIFSILFFLGAATLSAFIIMKPELLHSEIVLAHSGNYIDLAPSPYYIAYISYSIVAILLTLGFTLFALGRARRANERASLTALLVGTALAGLVVVFFNLFLPLVRFDLIWLGPIAIAVNTLCYYYSVLRYRLLPATANWLRLLSYIILILALAVIYIIIFFLLFAALFRGAAPSLEIIILNFSMILTFIFLIPAYNELTSSVRSQMSNSIDLTYIVKKLTSLKKSKIDLRELTVFLAGHLHFQYIGILTSDRLYGSKNIVLTNDVVSTIRGLKESEHGVWTPISAKAKNILDTAGVEAVAEIRNASGRRVGQVVFGKPTNKPAFDQRTDFKQIEIVLGLVEGAVNTKTNTKAKKSSRPRKAIS